MNRGQVISPLFSSSMRSSSRSARRPKGSGFDDTGTSGVSIESLKLAMNRLKPYSDVEIDKLPLELKKDYETVSEIIGLSSETDIYPEIISAMRSTYNETSNSRIGTVGSFFKACFLKDNFPGPIACSAGCSSGVQPPSGTSGFVDCTDAVYVLDHGKFKLNSSPKKGHQNAIIHIIGGPESLLKDVHVKEVMRNGASTVSVWLVNENMKYTQVVNKEPIMSLLNKINAANTKPVQTNPSSTPPPHKKDETTNWFPLFLLFIFFALLIGAVLVSNRRRS